MPEIPTITWRDLTGNKFVTSLDTAMLSKDGYVKQQKIRRVGEPVPAVFNVVYDREYFLEILRRKFVEPLSVLGKEKTLKLIDEAWTSYDKKMLTPPGLSRSNY